MDHEWHYTTTFPFSHVRKLKMKYISVILFYTILDTQQISILFIWRFCICAILYLLDAWSFKHINFQYHVSNDCKHGETWHIASTHYEANHFYTFLSEIFQYVLLDFIKNCNFRPHFCELRIEILCLKQFLSKLSHWHQLEIFYCLCTRFSRLVGIILIPGGKSRWRSARQKITNAHKTIIFHQR